MNKKGYFERQWLAKVSNVFDTRPRDASNKKVVWLPREEQESRLSDLLLSTKHICVDGPTGTGKSSLSLTTLGISELKYVPVQIAQDMSWHEFCKNLVKRPYTGNERTISTEIEAGLKSGLPTAVIKVSLGSSLPNPQNVLEHAKGWTVHDVCYLMDHEKKSLFIDDFEKANDEIITHVADMAKLLTQTFSSNKSK